MRVNKRVLYVAPGSGVCTVYLLFFFSVHLSLCTVDVVIITLLVIVVGVVCGKTGPNKLKDIHKTLNTQSILRK